MREWMYRSTFSLTSALVGGEWSASRSGRFTPGERAPSTHWTGGWGDPTAGLDDVGKRKFLTIPGLELWQLGRPVRSQSLYWLRYPGSFYFVGLIIISNTYVNTDNTFRNWTYILTTALSNIWKQILVQKQYIYTGIHIKEGMYVCMYVYVYVCIYVCMYVCMYVCIRGGP
jgi:hypothetical protein